MKKTKLLVALLVVLILAALVPAVYAFMLRGSQTIANTFVPATVTCEVAETMGTALNDQGKVCDAKTSVKVQNTGNVDAYIKVQLVFYWQDSKGDVVGRDVTPDYSVNSGWLSAGNHLYYYKYPVAPGQFTGELLDPNNLIVMNPVNEPYNNIDYIYYPVVEIIAEAIQSVPEEEIEQSWGITITGVEITAIS